MLVPEAEPWESDGRTLSAVFSSERELLRALPEGTRYLAVRGADLARAWPADLHLALNPGGDLETVLAPEQVRALAGGRVVAARRVEQGTPVAVGPPAEEPVELLETLRAVVCDHPDVVAAYRALMALRAPDERPRLVIGLELAPGSDTSSVLADVAERAARAPGPAPSFVEVDRASPSVVSSWMLDEAGPFYRR